MLTTDPALPPLLSTAPVPATAPAKPTRSEICAWVIMGLALFFILHWHLLSALLAGMFVYSMVHRLAVRLILYKILHKHAKLAAMLILSFALIAVSTLIVLAVIGIARGHVGGVKEVMKQILAVVESKRNWFTARGIGDWIPEPEKLYAMAFAALEKFRARIENGDTLKIFLHALIGIVIGALLSFQMLTPKGPLSAAFYERARRLLIAFESVIFAQVQISAINTLFTSIYLLIGLPLFGVNLPLRGTLIMVTFLFGMLPVVGNLMSNAVIVLLSLGFSEGVAISSFVFLVVIHKLEYFLNAKIVGGHIGAAAWEILLVMLGMEAVFGIPGMILAPIAYAYVKSELKSRGLI